MNQSLNPPSKGSRVPSWLSRPVREVTKKLAVSGAVEVGDSSRIGRSAVVSSAHGLKIGRRVSIGPRSIVQVDGEIGDFTLIGQAVQIIGRADHDFRQLGVTVSDSTWVGERNQIPQDVVNIGRDVWIGGGSIVLSGIDIGDAAIVGAGSVVRDSVPPGAIVLGNPARVVAWRFDSLDDLRKHLLAIDQDSLTRSQDGTDDDDRKGP